MLRQVQSGFHLVQVLDGERGRLRKIPLLHRFDDAAVPEVGLQGGEVGPGAFGVPSQPTVNGED